MNQDAYTELEKLNLEIARQRAQLQEQMAAFREKFGSNQKPGILPPSAPRPDQFIQHEKIGLLSLPRITFPHPNQFWC